MPRHQDTAAIPMTDQEQLRIVAPVIVTACPGIQEEAHAVASEILQKHGITGLDPDQVWWHRFNTISASSQKAFLGWEHAPTPSESLTLTQLVIHRYRVTDQDNADLLDGDGGFYTADASANVYNETNEVRMYPSEVLKDLWEMDFSDRYLTKLNNFWRTHFDDFRTLAKCNYLNQAVQARQNLQLEEADFQTVVRAVIDDQAWPITRVTLASENPVPTGTRICVLDVAGHVASDILRIVGHDGRQITYVPGATQAFQVHPTPTDLHWWVLMQMNDDALLAAFLMHFPPAERQAINDGITPLMNQLVSTWGARDHHLINQKNVFIHGDAFTWLSHSVKTTMLTEADLTLVTNGHMRQQLWLGYLTVGLHVFGPLAVLGWPIALAVIGASAAAMGLNIDKAVHGKTAAERKAGVIGAVLDSINIVFNIPLLKEVNVLEEVGASVDAAEATEMASLQITDEPGAVPVSGAPEAPVIAPLRAFKPLEREAGQPLSVPEHWQSNEILESDAVIANSGKFQAIYSLNSNPSNAIMLNDDAYYVRYESDVNGGGTWAIIDPQSPNATSGSIPVNLTAEGKWVITSKTGLKGGGNDLIKPLRKPPQAVSGSQAPTAIRLVSSPYDTPPNRQLRYLALGIRQTHVKVFLTPEGLKSISTYQDLVATRRAVLIANSRKTLFKNDFFASLPARPVQPSITPSTTVTQLLQNVFESAPGLVIGEAQNRIASMRFLIENMQTFAREGVKTLYMHRLLNDFSQVDLNAFARTGEMSEELEAYLTKLQDDPSGIYTPLQVVRLARRNNIRIQAIDCLASYKYESASTGSVSEQAIKNFYSNTIIQANESLNGAGKWVILTGQENTNTFRGLPGISEMNGGIGLRIEEVLPGRETLFEIDHGIEIGHNLAPTQTQMAGGVETLYADLHLQMPTPMVIRTATEIDKLLFREGMFVIDKTILDFTLIHRSRTGQLIHTLIERTVGGGFLIQRPAWVSVHNISYSSLEHLAHALIRMGLTLEGRLPV